VKENEKIFDEANLEKQVYFWKEKVCLELTRDIVFF
jgi:hypothetical protein